MSEMPLDGAALRGAVDLSSLANRGASSSPQQQTPGQPAGQGEEASAGPVAVDSLVLDGTDQTVETFVELSMQVPVLVDLWAEWCGPCKQLTPVLEKVVADYAGRILLMKVDVDANPQLAQVFQAQSIPTVGVLLGGRPMQVFQGAVPEAQVREVIEQVLQIAAQNGVTGTATVTGAPDEPEDAEPEPEPLPPLHQEAHDAIDRGDYDAAVAAYDKAIAQNPKDDEARAGRAQVRLLARVSGASLEEVRAAAASAPGDLDAQLAVADMDISGGHIDDAFDRLLSLFPELDDDGKATVRERLLELFEIVGADPRVTKARARLAGLLF
ncbi:tetratricopeptide repeat protein [Microbacterium sp. MPKO10]|uniref:tetratricopeptide repeat protein n=1 Tax=Microbacterium sp. MPKO10 TaxID=2989818 RepID=UPI0022362528|nr:tetratricopeptide repeat protein [Microbacterium sp. MPKO10]MCW4459356.1 tetratricopeptide repeat protein [Microbacterium sp. MPKO10]